jgi:hypothetical protein
MSVLRTLTMVRRTTTATTSQHRTLHFCGPKTGSHRCPHDLPPHYLAGSLAERGAYINREIVAKPTTTWPTQSDPKNPTITQYATRLNKCHDGLESAVLDKMGRKVKTRKAEEGVGAVRMQNGDWKI